jgi:hypothetical protein
MRFFINSFGKVVIFLKHGSYTLFLVGLSMSVSVNPSRPSVIFHMACLRVPLYLQLYIFYSLLMPQRSMGVSLRHSQITMPYLCQFRTGECLRWDPIATQLFDGLLRTIKDKSERFENTCHFFTRCCSPRRLPCTRIVINGQEVPWSLSVKYQGAEADWDQKASATFHKKISKGPENSSKRPLF